MRRWRRTSGRSRTVLALVEVGEGVVGVDVGFVALDDIVVPRLVQIDASEILRLDTSWRGRLLAAEVVQ